MKIGMKGGMGVADKMALLVLGSRARSARNCTQSAPERTYLQFMVARSDGLRARSACNCARSAPERTYLQFMVVRSDELQ